MVISTDGINHFLGDRYYQNSSIAIAQTEISTLLTNALGSGRFGFYIGTSAYVGFFWRPNLVDEVFTGSISSTNSGSAPGASSPQSYCRFDQLAAVSASASSFRYFALNSTNSNNTTSSYKMQSKTMNVIDEVVVNSTFNLIASTDHLLWVTATNQSICSFWHDPESKQSVFVWCGVLVDTNSNIITGFPQKCAGIVIAQDSQGDKAWDAFRVDVMNTANKRQSLISGDANYSISCSDAQAPGSDGWATDLFLIDNNSTLNNPYAGRCQNLLLAKGSSFILGELYNLNTAHKDGGSSRFLCVGNWGTDKVLMRITSN